MSGIAVTVTESNPMRVVVDAPEEVRVITIAEQGPPGSGSGGGTAGALLAANNLSDLANSATARSNLGLGSAAQQPSSSFEAAGSALLKSSNLSDVPDKAAARTNLGISTIPTVPLYADFPTVNSMLPPGGAGRTVAIPMLGGVGSTELVDNGSAWIIKRGQMLIDEWIDYVSVGNYCGSRQDLGRACGRLGRSPRDGRVAVCADSGLGFWHRHLSPSQRRKRSERVHHGLGHHAKRFA